VRYPEADGGSGLDKISDCIVREELSYLSQAFAIELVGAHAPGHLADLEGAGTPEQRERFFKPAMSRAKIAGFALSEPDGGSNVRACKTTGRQACPAAGSSTAASSTSATRRFADFLLVAARTRPELTPEAISLFIVELPNAGFDTHKLRKEGIRGSETGLIHIHDAFVPDEACSVHREGTYPVILES
jgi:butyryl-CoA dehydrogenase